MKFYAPNVVFWNSFFTETVPLNERVRELET